MESFNGKLRDELLNRELFDTLKEVQVLIENWRREYKPIRPHSELGYRPPAPESILPPLAGRDPQRVLVIKFFGLGSIGYSSVIVNDLRKKFPHIHISLLTFAENRSFLDIMNCYNKVITLDKNRPLNFIFDTIRIALVHLLRRPYDVCIDLEYFSKYTCIHTVFTRAPMRIGFYMSNLWRRHTYTHYAYFNTAKHVCRVYGTIAELAGADRSAEQPMMIAMRDEDLLAVTSQILVKLGWDQTPFVGVNVNASDLTLGRRWPRERFAVVIEQIVQRGYWVFLTGSPSEREFVQGCLDLVDAASREKVRNVAGEFSLCHFFAFLQQVSLFLTNDSGPMIFANLTDTPSVSLWGPGDPAMYGGSPPRHSFVYSDYPCSPCMYVPDTDAGKFCGETFPCMDAISAEQVIATLLNRLPPV